MKTTTNPVRGCGTRVKGGVYAEVHLTDGVGVPVEHFLLDPPLVLDFAKLGVTAVGTKLIERDGIYHIVDMVGSSHYPNVADFVEEVRRFGVSRRLARTLDFSKITAGSRLLLGHSRAYIGNFDDYACDWEYRGSPTKGHPFPRCPKGIAHHDQEIAPGFCVGAYWQDVEGGEIPEGESSEGRVTERVMPSFTYRAFSRPKGVHPIYQAAIFASFPIHRLVGIKDTPDADRETARVLAAASVPSVLVND